RIAWASIGSADAYSSYRSYKPVIPANAGIQSDLGATAVLSFFNEGDGRALPALGAGIPGRSSVGAAANAWNELSTERAQLVVVAGQPRRVDQADAPSFHFDQPGVGQAVQDAREGLRLDAQLGSDQPLGYVQLDHAAAVLLFLQQEARHPATGI